MKKMFSQAQKIFIEFSERFLNNNLLQQKFLDAIKNLLSLYDTKIYENRFIVGGVIEFIVLASFKGLGFEAKHIGKENDRFDIEVQYNNLSSLFSIKSTFTKSSNIRLINVLGESRNTKWEEPTIFILPHYGVGYSDNTLIDTNNLIRQKDVIVIKRTSLEDFFQKEPKFLIPLDKIPYKDDIES